jgi:hypothetical protein
MKGTLQLQNVCALPQCTARRQVDFDEKKLRPCPCRSGTYYCSVEHQRLDFARHKVNCSAAKKIREAKAAKAAK